YRIIKQLQYVTLVYNFLRDRNSSRIVWLRRHCRGCRSDCQNSVLYLCSTLCACFGPGSFHFQALMPGGPVTLLGLLVTLTFLNFDLKSRLSFSCLSWQICSLPFFSPVHS